MKFNEKKQPEFVENYMGETAYKQTPETELVFAVVTTFLEDMYYESAQGRMDRISELVPKCDPLFVAKLAVYAREVFYLRSVSHFLINRLTKVISGDAVVRAAVNRIVKRGDDITEIASTYLLNGEKLPNQVKLGLADRLLTMDRYQLAKYRGDGNTVKLVDVFNLVHPKPQDEGQTELFRQSINGELKLTEHDTWEAALSSGKEKGQAFLDLLKNKKLPYMATLRNLRNILESGNDEAVQLAADYISNPIAVKNSKQLPFRFLSAYGAVANMGRYNDMGDAMKFYKKSTENQKVLLYAIVQAVHHSVNNIPELDGDTVILIDNSGSMRGDMGGLSTLSSRSSKSSADVANLLGLLYWERCKSTWVGLFGDKLLDINMKLDPEKNVFENFAIMDKALYNFSGGTEHGIYVAFNRMIDENIHPKRVVIFSDQQIGTGNRWYGTGRGTNSGNFINLQKQFQTKYPDTMIYSVDLRGYGNTVFDDRVVKLAGFSEKIFTLMDTYEKRNTMLADIRAIQL